MRNCVPSLCVKLTCAPGTAAPLMSSTTPETLADPCAEGVCSTALWWSDLGRGAVGRELLLVPGSTVRC
jgi:hypothetical protein